MSTVNLGNGIYSFTVSGVCSGPTSGTTASFVLDNLSNGDRGFYSYDVLLSIKSPNVSKVTTIKTFINYGSKWVGGTSGTGDGAGNNWYAKLAGSTIIHSDVTANPAVSASCPISGGPITLSLSGLDNSGGAYGYVTYNAYFVRVPRI